MGCGTMNNNLPSKVLAEGQRLYGSGNASAPYVLFTESDHVVHWRSLALLSATIQGLDANTYYTPYRLEESYLQTPTNKFAARVKDTTGPVVAVDGETLKP